MKNTTSLYTLIKEKAKTQKARIVCDWNDVIQDSVSYPLWDIEKKLIDKEEVTAYEDYFQKFWSQYNGDMYWREDKELNELVNEYWKDSEYFNKSPFLSIAEELLLALQEGMIEELIFLSSYSERVHPGGDKRKLEKFQATFGLFSQVKGLNLIPANSESKGGWLSANYPEFDIFIDDSPKKVQNVMEKFPDKIYVLPFYKCNEHVQGENVYHVETRVSGLSIEKFTQLAQGKKNQIENLWFKNELNFNN